VTINFWVDLKQNKETFKHVRKTETNRTESMVNAQNPTRVNTKLDKCGSWHQEKSLARKLEPLGRLARISHKR